MIHETKPGRTMTDENASLLPSHSNERNEAIYGTSPPHTTNAISPGSNHPMFPPPLHPATNNITYSPARPPPPTLLMADIDTLHLSPPQAYIDTSSERRRPSSIAAIAAAEVIVRRESQVAALILPHHPQQQSHRQHRMSCAANFTGPSPSSSPFGISPDNYSPNNYNALRRISCPASSPGKLPRLPFIHVPSTGSMNSENNNDGDVASSSYQTNSVNTSASCNTLYEQMDMEDNNTNGRSDGDTNHVSNDKIHGYTIVDVMGKVISQIPAIAIASVLNFMVGIPFGASYFPVEWSSNIGSSGFGIDANSSHGESSPAEGEFPLPGKEALGLRMFLFSTMIAQFVFTFKSKFNNGVGLQMVENVPFCLELARIVIEEQGYGIDALSTLFFLFGFSSVIVGAVFYLLGKLELGRVVYFFPSHVLVGCIGGIGAFIIATSVEVSTNTVFHFTVEAVNECIIKHMHLWLPVVAFELTLRMLQKGWGDRYPLLAPIYYCLITPAFYLCLYFTGIDWESAANAGYFFPPISSTGSVYNNDLIDIFTIINLKTISWKAVMKSIPTMMSLTAFSLIHVPINIPAFAISTNVEPDMNAELIAHGYSNGFSGIFGGLQNYMAYSNSVIYSKSDGKGRASSLGIVITSIAIFVYGPTMASYVPRCMAGTLLLHVGIDLFLEGVYESFHDYDRLEYSGIWLITVVMVVFGMDAALVAGVIAALSTYAVQSITYQYPIRGAMTAARLRSSAWNRSVDAQEILLDRMKGRQRIYVIQMQGHIFFGNVTTMTDEIKRSLREKLSSNDGPIVVILDFSHVLGIDSSAAQTIAKLKDSIRSNYGVELVIFVTGKVDGFPCSYDLSQKVHDISVKSSTSKRLLEPKDLLVDCDELSPDPVIIELESSLNVDLRSSIRFRALNISSKNTAKITFPNSRVCQTLDDALVFAEDVLIAIQDPDLLQQDVNESTRVGHRNRSAESTFKVIEERGAKMFLETLCMGASDDDISFLFDVMNREKYSYGDIIWEQGSASNSLKLLVSGSLISSLEDENGATETIYPGSTIGELGLVNGTERLTTVKVLSSEAILYSLCREQWETLARENPRLAREIDMIVVRYLTHRIQHVSNHILDRRSLPV